MAQGNVLVIGINFYNNKCLVFIVMITSNCIYNISLLALFAVKLFNPQIKTNILSNILLRDLIFY